MPILRPVRGRGDSCSQYAPRSNAKHLTANRHACYIPIRCNSIFRFVPRKSAVFDSTIGRWQTKDPKSFDAGDTNLYRFVGNHPSYATDPSGLEHPANPQSMKRFYLHTWATFPGYDSNAGNFRNSALPQNLWVKGSSISRMEAFGFFAFPR